MLLIPAKPADYPPAAQSCDGEDTEVSGFNGIPSVRERDLMTRVSLPSRLNNHPLMFVYSQLARDCIIVRAMMSLLFKLTHSLSAWVFNLLNSTFVVLSRCHLSDVTVWQTEGKLHWFKSDTTPSLCFLLLFLTRNTPTQLNTY